MTSRTRLKRKEVDDVLGGEEMWKHADSIAGDLSPKCCPCAPRLMVVFPASCDKCNHGRAYFLQLQIRSADEPMTTCKLRRFLVVVFLTISFLFSVYRRVNWEHPSFCRLLIVFLPAVPLAGSDGTKTNVHVWMASSPSLSKV
jgi:hypothetical protein